VRIKLRCSVLFLVLSFAIGAMCLAAQDDEDNHGTFTGTLVENTPDHLKVSRVLLGKTEEHVFKVNAQTKIEGGRLRLRVRINVRYLSDENGDTAILVIVRPPAPKAKK
jgi:hypothetical protein